ncbi:MAG: glutathione S-transferase N-terminal domain-containing protein [Ketobacteraceae bacterium]|nr:glutathione S-transferase N-terminal domain-containing protein [Ketobacteraceae bacterium]
MGHLLEVSASTLASTVRNWKGSYGSKSVVQPDKPIRLYDRENCPECRLAREALTELNLDAEIYPCPEGGHRYLDTATEESNGEGVPLLIDLNTGEKAVGAHGIATYLFRQYKHARAPQRLTGEGLSLVTSKLATLVRRQHGKAARPSRPAEKLLTLYSFESSPFSRLVRERLCEYELAYRLINLGKQQLADIGPAKPRLLLKPYRPLENTKRWDFWKEHGNVQVPYLIDPNTDTRLFESADILAYLDRTYGAQAVG